MNNPANLILVVSIWAMFLVSTAEWSVTLVVMLDVLKNKENARLVMWPNIINAATRLNVHLP